MTTAQRLIRQPLRRRRFTGMRGGALPYLLILPVVVVLVTIAGWPLIKIILLSLQKQESGKYALFHSGGATPVPGLTNYANTLTDSMFWTVAFRTLVFTAVNVLLSLVIGMALAQLLNRVSKW